MKFKAVITSAAFMLSACLLGCADDSMPGVTEEQQAELDQSRADLAKRGWGDEGLTAVERPATESAEPDHNVDSDESDAVLPEKE